MPCRVVMNSICRLILMRWTRVIFPVRVLSCIVALHLRQYYDLLDGFADAPLGGLDIAEVSPPLDPSERTEFLAAEMLFRILRRFRTRPTVADRDMMEYIGTRQLGGLSHAGTDPCPGNPALDHGSCSTLSLRGFATR